MILIYKKKKMEIYVGLLEKEELRNVKTGELVQKFVFLSGMYKFFWDKRNDKKCIYLIRRNYG